MNLNSKTVSILCLVFLLIGGLLGGTIVYKMFPRIIIETHVKEVPVVQEKVVTQMVTEIQYVPKAIDPVTGAKEKTDVELNAKQPTVDVKVNGKDHEFKLEQTETQKFENGKVVLNQTGTIKFEVKTNEPKLLGVDAFVGNGYGVTVSYKKLSLDVNLSDIKKPKVDRVRFNLLQI